ncbi:MAG: hypothetical protein IKQ88_03535, partial [Lachnospiraceae bacterium]|nr:hypothetical protein [Lachnospiraceae bacterium]
YKALLIFFCTGLLCIAVLLCMLYKRLERFEKEMSAKTGIEVIDLTVSSDGTEAVSEDMTVSSDGTEAVSEDTAAVSGNSDIQTEADTEEDESSPYPLSSEEEQKVRETAEAFTRAYAVFALKKNASASETLSFVDRESALYSKLSRYGNEWGVTYDKDSFEKLEISNIKKLSEEPAKYSCEVDSLYTVYAGAGNNSYELKFSYILKADAASGKLLMEEMENR